MKKLIILDRDGVINYDSPNYIKTEEEWQAIPGSLEAIALLKQKAYQVAIATNQSGIGRGYYTLATFFAIQKKFESLLQATNGKIDKLVFCPHTPEDDCLCRKPKPGMLIEILSFFKIDPTKSTVYFVGDAITDIQAAKAANCQPILVRTGKDSATLEQLPPMEVIPVFNDLLAFVKSL